jgi:hypothetical protein
MSGFSDGTVHGAPAGKEDQHKTKDPPAAKLKKFHKIGIIFSGK